MEELPVYIPRPRVCHMTQYHCCKRRTTCPLYSRCSQIKFQNTVCCQDCPSCTYGGCSLSPQQRQDQPVYVDHVIQQDRLDMNLTALRWQEQQAHRKRHQKLYAYYNNLFGDRLDRRRKARYDRYWANPDYARTKHREAYRRQHPSREKQIPLDMLPKCGLDCFNCPFDDCVLPEDWLLQKRKEKRTNYLKLYYQEHQEEMDTQHRVYYLEHQEEMRVYSRLYYQKHRDEINARRRQRYQEKKKAEQPEKEETA